MKQVEVVAAIIRNEDRILCCQRTSNPLAYLSEKWEFPGGKIQEGETQQEALIREIDEELDMTINHLHFALTVVHQYPDFELTMHCYQAGTTATDFNLNVHQQAIWLPLPRLDELDWAAADIPIVKHLNNPA